MKRDIQQAAQKHYDLVIVGGGVYGMSTAWDASLRGLSVLLLEKDDFAHACSSANYKLIHGGLRYLQHLDFSRMRTSIIERRNMMTMAPHLVSPIEFVIPCYGHGIKGPEVMRAALMVNDIIGFDRNSGIQLSNQIPSGHVISQKECLHRLPELSPKGLTGGAVYYDAQMYSAERLSLSFGLSARQHGATLLNYVEALQFKQKAGRIVGVEAEDRLAGGRFTFSGDMFINMTGPWSEITRERINTDHPEPYVVRSKGVQLITRKLADCGFAVQSHQKDKTAVVSRGGRSLFVAPWRGYSFIGQSDTIYKGPPDEFSITQEDIDAFREEFNRAYPAAGLTREDIVHVIGGMIPVGDDDPNSGSTNVSHKYEILDHEKEDGIANMISVIGVKFTIARYIAETVVDQSLKKLNKPHTPSITAGTSVMGGNFSETPEHIQSAMVEVYSVSEKTADHLFHLHGSEAGALLQAANSHPEWLETVDESNAVLKLEVIHAVRNEMAVHLDDAVLRRLDLAATGCPAESTLITCADIMAQELGWDEKEKEGEIRRVLESFRYA